MVLFAVFANDHGTSLSGKPKRPNLREEWDHLDGCWMDIYGSASVCDYNICRILQSLAHCQFLHIMLVVDAIWAKSRLALRKFLEQLGVVQSRLLQLAFFQTQDWRSNGGSLLRAMNLQFMKLVKFCVVGSCVLCWYPSLLDVGMTTKGQLGGCTRLFARHRMHAVRLWKPGDKMG